MAIKPLKVKLPPRFYDDHVSRDLPAGVTVKRTKGYIEVELTGFEFDDLLSDAQHYATPGMYPEPEYRGLVASARATVVKLIDAWHEQTQVKS